MGDINVWMQGSINVWMLHRRLVWYVSNDYKSKNIWCQKMLIYPDLYVKTTYLNFSQRLSTFIVAWVIIPNPSTEIEFYQFIWAKMEFHPFIQKECPTKQVTVDTLSHDKSPSLCSLCLYILLHRTKVSLVTKQPLRDRS